MRKRIAAQSEAVLPQEKREWLDLEKIAEVEITSEAPASPIEAALVPGIGSDWIAAQPGEQTLRLRFDEPQKIRHIRLVFNEADHQRTQEFVLRWSPDGTAFREIVRQQYNFNPPASEVEKYDLNLDGVKALELKIIPDIGGGSAVASLAELRVA